MLTFYVAQKLRKKAQRERNIGSHVIIKGTIFQQDTTRTTRQSSRQATAFPVLHSDCSQQSDLPNSLDQSSLIEIIRTPFLKVFDAMLDADKYQLSGGQYLEDEIANILSFTGGTSTDEAMELLHFGVVPVAHFRSLFDQDDFNLIHKLLGPPQASHNLINCVKAGFANCQTSEDYARASRSWRHCPDCDFRELQYYLTATTWLADLHSQSPTEIRKLEGAYDSNIWSPLLDYPLRSPHTHLSRKETGSSLSNLRFDGLLVDGKKALEWLVIEVARPATDTIGTKQERDRCKVISQCMRMAVKLRFHVVSQLGLGGTAVTEVLRKLPIWGIKCEGLKMVVYKLVWISKDLMLLFNTTHDVPDHAENLPEVWDLLEQVYLMRVSSTSVVDDLIMSVRLMGLGQTQIINSVLSLKELYTENKIPI